MTETEPRAGAGEVVFHRGERVRVLSSDRSHFPFEVIGWEGIVYEDFPHEFGNPPKYLVTFGESAERGFWTFLAHELERVETPPPAPRPAGEG